MAASEQMLKLAATQLSAQGAPTHAHERGAEPIHAHVYTLAAQDAGGETEKRVDFLVWPGGWEMRCRVAAVEGLFDFGFHRLRVLRHEPSQEREAAIYLDPLAVVATPHMQPRFGGSVGQRRVDSCVESTRRIRFVRAVGDLEPQGARVDDSLPLVPATPDVRHAIEGGAQPVELLAGRGAGEHGSDPVLGVVVRDVVGCWHKRCLSIRSAFLALP